MMMSFTYRWWSRLGRARISPASTRSSGAAMASAAGAEDVAVAPELLTPPLGLVALLGRPDLHPAVREALRTEARPPMECLSGGELEDASRVLVARKRSRPPADPLAAAAALAAANPAAPSAGDAPGSVPGFVPAPAPTAGPPVGLPPVATASAPAPAPAPGADALHPGCLKAGWLAKHRRLRPALALVFLDREDVEGDPNRWISLSTRLDAARAAAEAADCKLAVVVVDEGGVAAEARGSVSDDRRDAVRRRAKIDPRALATLSLPPTPDAAKALAALCKALCAEHYAKEANRRAARTHVDDDALGSAANPAFKAGAFSEFKGDWAGAARWYGRAHQALVAAHGAGTSGAAEARRSLTGNPLEPFRLQARHAALLAAANAAYKKCALSLMLDPDAPRDAVAHFQAHAAAFKKPPTWLPREYLPEHHAWLASQYAAFGRLLASRVAWGAGGESGGAAGRPFAPPPPGSPRTYLPGFYFHAAANAAEARRRSLEAAMDASEASTSTPSVELRPGPREGTFVNAATGALVPDAVFLRDLLSNAKETFAALPAARVRLLAEAREHYKRALAFSSDGPTPKHARLFASLTSQLAAGTLTAGDVAAAERLFRAAAAVYRREKWDDLLGVTLMALKECYRRADARRAHLETCLELAALGAGNGAVLASGHGAFDADAAAHAAQAAMREVGRAPDANVVAVGGGDAEGANGVDRAFRCVAGFRAARAVPGEPVRFTAAIRWALPFEVPVASVAVEFSEPAYAWRRAAKDDRAAGEDAPAALRPGAWHRVAADVTPKWGHPVRATAIVVTLETGISFRAAFGSGAEKGATRDGRDRANEAGEASGGVLRGVFETDRLPDFMTDVRVGVHALDLRGAAPRVSLEARLAGPALLGEACALPLAVVSTGDAMDAVELAFKTRGDSEVSEVSAAETVEVTRDGGGAPLGPNDVVPVGRVAPGRDWRGVVYVRRRALGPPVTLVVELRGTRDAPAGEDGPAAAPPPPRGARPRPELETEVEVAVRAPFAATRETTAAYRAHALSFEAAGGSEATRLMTRLRVGAAGSRLRITGADAAGTKSATCFFPVALDEGDEFLHVVDSARGAPAPELSVSWRRAESSDELSLSRDACTVIPATAAASQTSASGEETGPAPVTVTLSAPPRARVGVPFEMRARCANATSQAQPLRVRVADAAGFVFSGSRECLVTVAPRAETETAYTLVALRSGEAALPEVEVTCLRLGAALRPPRVARAMVVEP
jgi:hypothetical protein